MIIKIMTMRIYILAILFFLFSGCKKEEFLLLKGDSNVRLYQYLSDSSKRNVFFYLDSFGDIDNIISVQIHSGFGSLHAFHPNRKLKFYSQILNGESYGIVYNFDSLGRITMRYKVVNDKKNGEYFEYFEDGNVGYTGQYFDDNPVGIHYRYYNLTGQIRNQIVYDSIGNFLVERSFSEEGTLFDKILGMNIKTISEDVIEVSLLYEEFEDYYLKLQPEEGVNSHLIEVLPSDPKVVKLRFKEEAQEVKIVIFEYSIPENRKAGFSEMTFVF
jgi:antitoxin component YwqK of YwqJK toxin-antitoxin module